jgi:DNA-binding NtrC family response regulator
MNQHTARILIIDDDPALLASLAEMLTIRLWRIEVDTCNQPTSAVALATARAYNLILCDCWMPDINGLDLLPRLRETDPRTAILMMSGSLNDVVRQTALACGATDVLAKPFDRENVTLTLKAALKDQARKRQQSAAL